MFPHLAILVPHISTTRLLIWRLLFIIYLTHAPSFGNSGSSYIFKHAPSFGHSGSTHILNTPPLRRFQSIMYLISTPPHLATPVQHVSTTRPKARVFIFLLWPLFARAPRHWFLENFLLSAPGVQSVFFLLRSVGRRDLSAGPEQKKKNTTQGVLFFAPAPGKGRGRRSPVPARGQSKKKKHHPGCFVFCSGPGERQGKEKPRAGTGPEQKKQHHPGCFFFCCGPGERQEKEKPRWAPARGQSKKQTPHRVFLFLLRPWGKAGQGEAPLGAGTGPEQKKKHHTAKGKRRRSPVGRRHGARAKKKNTTQVFFFFAPALGKGRARRSPVGRRHGARAKKKHPWVVCFFLLRPRADAHSLTAGLGGDASPSPGWCFFCCGPARTGVVFFFLLWPRPDAHSLTVGWGDFGKARVVFFFLLRPRRVFLDNKTNVWGTTSSLKRPGGATAKKKTPLPTSQTQ